MSEWHLTTKLDEDGEKWEETWSFRPLTEAENGLFAFFVLLSSLGGIMGYAPGSLFASVGSFEKG